MKPRFREMLLLGTLIAISACEHESFSNSPVLPGVQRQTPGRTRSWRLVMPHTSQPAEFRSTPSDLEQTAFEAQMPADGNGNKVVFPIEVEFPVSCGAETIDFSFQGWGQARIFAQPKNRNVELDVFHALITYTNSARQTFTWREVGPDHYYLDRNGDLIVSVIGRASASGNPDRNEMVIGHVRINLTTLMVEFVAGKELGNIDQLACDALT